MTINETTRNYIHQHTQDIGWIVDGLDRADYQDIDIEEWATNILTTLGGQAAAENGDDDGLAVAHALDNLDWLVQQLQAWVASAQLEATFDALFEVGGILQDTSLYDETYAVFAILMTEYVRYNRLGFTVLIETNDSDGSNRAESLSDMVAIRSKKGGYVRMPLTWISVDTVSLLYKRGAEIVTRPQPKRIRPHDIGLKGMREQLEAAVQRWKPVRGFYEATLVLNVLGAGGIYQRVRAILFPGWAAIEDANESPLPSGWEVELGKQTAAKLRAFDAMLKAEGYDDDDETEVTYVAP